jgi:hypothetical protein
MTWAQFGLFRTVLVNTAMTFWVAFCNGKGCFEQLNKCHLFKKDIVSWGIELFSGLFIPPTLTVSCWENDVTRVGSSDQLL